MYLKTQRGRYRLVNWKTPKVTLKTFYPETELPYHIDVVSYKTGTTNSVFLYIQASLCCSSPPYLSTSGKQVNHWNKLLRKSLGAPSINDLKSRRDVLLESVHQPWHQHRVRFCGLCDMGGQGSHVSNL